MNLAGKVALVTGAGTGIGRALAMSFAAENAAVACLGRRVEPLDKTVALIRAAGGRAEAFVTDVTDIAFVRQAVERSANAFGPIDLVFNNAGRFAAVGPVWDSDPETWWHDVSVNLRGTYLICRTVLPAMMARDKGVIINMDGGGGAAGPNLGGSAYGCSKAAVVRFTEGLARELEAVGSGVLAFTMFPGFVRTDMTENLVVSETGRDWQPFVVNALETGEGLPPSACAAATLRLLSIAGPELNGCAFSVDTDFSAVDQYRHKIAANRLLTMRLVPLPI